MQSSVHSRLFPVRILTAALGLLALVATVRADDAKAVTTNGVVAAPKKKNWESVATAGFTLTRGNSHTFGFAGSVTTKRNWTNNEVLLGANVGYGNTSTTVGGKKVETTTDSYVKLYGQWNHFITTRAYAGARVNFDHDDVAALTYRATLSPLVGYYFVKTNNSNLAGEIGPSGVREKFFGQPAKDYLGLRLAERGDHKFANGAKVWESADWVAQMDKMNNYLLNMEIGVSAPISKALSVSLILQDTYKNVPAIGKLKNDLKLIGALSYAF